MSPIGCCVLVCVGPLLSARASDPGVAGREFAGKFAEYQQARAADPSGVATAIAANNLASVCHDLGRAADAERYYEIALRIFESRNSPDTLSVLLNLACLYMEGGEYARAARLNLERWTKDASGTVEEPRLTFSIAVLQFGQGRLAEAQARFEELLSYYQSRSMYVDSAATLNALGLVAATRRHTGEAVEFFERAAALLREKNVRMGPGPSRIFANLAAAYASEGRRDDVQRACADAVQAAEGDGWPQLKAAVLRQCADSLRKSGFKTEAHSLEQRAGQIVRDDPELRARRWTVDAADLMPRR